MTDKKKGALICANCGADLDPATRAAHRCPEPKAKLAAVPKPDAKPKPGPTDDDG